MIQVPEKFEIDYIDQSAISKCNRCPAAYMFSRLMGLEKPESMRIAMDYGTDMHRAFPYCYDGVDGVDVALSAFEEGWSKRSYGDADPKRNMMTAESSLINFCNTHSPNNCGYKIEHYPIQAETAEIISPNEIPFLIDIGGPLSAAGRIDLAVRRNSANDLWTDDYKTASEISPRYFDNFNACPQACLYTLALSHIANERAQGMIIEAVRVSKTNFENQMHYIFVRDHQIESFVQLANRTAEQILIYNERKTWPKQCTGCGPYSMFGQPGRMCDYVQLCNEPDWRDVVRFYKKVEPFHPFRISK